MLHTVLPEERRILHDLFADVSYERVLIDAILEGSLGAALADNLIAPRVALLRTVGESFYILSGDAGAPDARALAREVRPERAAVWAPPGSWRALLESVHGAKLGPPCYQTSFRGNAIDIEVIHTLKQLPAGFMVRRIDEQVAEYLRQHFWNAPSNFVNAGFGFYASPADQFDLACYVVSYCIAKGRVHVTLETFPAYRRLGLATATAAYFVEHCLQHNLEPYWMTNNDNQASYRLALKLGLKPENVYTTYGENV